MRGEISIQLRKRLIRKRLEINFTWVLFLALSFLCGTAKYWNFSKIENLSKERD